MKKIISILCLSFLANSSFALSNMDACPQTFLGNPAKMQLPCQLPGKSGSGGWASTTFKMESADTNIVLTNTTSHAEKVGLLYYTCIDGKPPQVYLAEHTVMPNSSQTVCIQQACLDPTYGILNLALDITGRDDALVVSQ